MRNRAPFVVLSTLILLLVNYGTSLPSACVPGTGFVDSTTAAPRICVCSATDTWKCAQTQIKSATAPYACSAGVAGDIYYDSTTPSPCWCDGGIVVGLIDAATQALVLAAERWPEFRELQSALASSVAEYQRLGAASVSFKAAP